MADLLLHSLREFKEIVLPCLEIVGARAVCEIGSEEGGFSEMVADWTEEREGDFYCIEPLPSERVLRRDAHSPSFHLLVGRSVDLLGEMPPCDVYFVDGEHNHYTVSQELGLIEQAAARAGRRYLAVLHDVGWPFGRRDGYFRPDLYPPGAVHEHTFTKGVTLDEPGVVEGGFRSEGVWAFALREGGRANGVRTAVDDFRSERTGLAYLEVPVVFGLGFLFAESAPYAGALAEFLAPYHDHPLLHRLERNRLELYLAVLALQDQLAATSGAGREGAALRRGGGADELARRIKQMAGKVRSAAWRRCKVGSPLV